MAEKKLKIKLLSYNKNSIRTVTAAIRQCYSSDGAAKISRKVTPEKARRLIQQIIGSGHTSTIEHAVFTFAIEGVSRAMTHQLVRHRIASYSQQSQRYVKEGKLDFIMPPSVSRNLEANRIFKEAIKTDDEYYQKLLALDIPPEDARFLLPNAAETKIVVTMNARALMNFLQERLCTRAQWEIRILAQEIYKIVYKVAPEIFRYAGPTCETEGICWQGKMYCGKKINKKKQKIEVRERI
jgi:thymidylate synthase (FAD)